MNKVIQLYKISFISILALYIYLGKGIAYGYLAEILLITGILLLIKQRRTTNLITNKSSIILYLLLIINLCYIAAGIMKFGFINTIRDSFIINYIYFIQLYCLLYIFYR